MSRISGVTAPASTLLSFEIELPQGIEADSVRGYIASESADGSIVKHLQFAEAVIGSQKPVFQCERAALTSGRYFFVYAFRQAALVAAVDGAANALLGMDSKIYLVARS